MDVEPLAEPVVELVLCPFAPGGSTIAARSHRSPQTIDRYRWNAQHFQIAAAGLGGRRVPGVDDLLLYWIARDGGLISPDA
jgi:hypothetical protein